MEEFRSSPVPSLRITNPNSMAFNASDFDANRKPPTLRRSTDPSPTSPNASWSMGMNSIPYRPRTASPLSGAHSRSRSAASITLPMSRAHSLPGLHGSGYPSGGIYANERPSYSHDKVSLHSPQLQPTQFRPASPSGSPSRVRAPRKAPDDAFPPQSPVRSSVLEPERRHRERSSSPAGLGVATSSRLRRTSSPFRNNPHYTTGSLASQPSSIASSPSYRAYDGNSTLYLSAISSVPSTPTSTRSRSPSISSLETIPDSPDAEEAAVEGERIAQLKAAADAAEGAADAKGRGSLDVPTRGRTLTYGSKEKRKRWSVCGAERRGDLDLETIWED